MSKRTRVTTYVGLDAQNILLAKEDHTSKRKVLVVPPPPAKKVPRRSANPASSSYVANNVNAYAVATTSSKQTYLMAVVEGCGSINRRRKTGESH